MERVRVVVFGCLLALGLLFCPSAAYASDGFLGGLEDLTGARQVDDEGGYEEEYLEEYRPTLRAGDDSQAVGEISPLQGLRQFMTDGFSFEFNGVVRQLYSLVSLRTVLILAVTVGVLFVFFWWGVRKSIHMIFSGFRKGRVPV